MKPLPFLLTFFVSCTASLTREPAPANPASNQEPAASAHEKFDPSMLNEPWDIVSHKKPAAIKPYNDSADLDLMTASAVPAELTRLGFRVQLVSSSNYYEALRMRDSAGTHLNGEIYLDYEPPYYKVRFGNYTQREFADTMISVAREAGFHDAWVVRTNVQIKN